MPTKKSSTTTQAGWMPGATRHSTPNFAYGRSGQKPIAVCLHVTAGQVGHEYENAISWLCNPDSKASVHFIVSQAGDISQLVSINDEAFGNGLSYENGHWIDPEGSVVTPSWVGLQVPINPNLVTISCETARQPDDALSPAMLAALTKILQWIHSQFGLVYQPGTSLIGHYAISPINRPNCPGPLVPYATIAAAANGPPAKRFTFIVESAGTSLIRQGPATSYPVAGTLHQGATILSDVIVPGETITGNDQWAHVASGLGFVSMTVLKEIVS